MKNSFYPDEVIERKTKRLKIKGKQKVEGTVLIKEKKISSKEIATLDIIQLKKINKNDNDATIIFFSIFSKETLLYKKFIDNVNNRKKGLNCLRVI